MNILFHWCFPKLSQKAPLHSLHEWRGPTWVCWTEVDREIGQARSKIMCGLYKATWYWCMYIVYCRRRMKICCTMSFGLSSSVLKVVLMLHSTTFPRGACWLVVKTESNDVLDGELYVWGWRTSRFSRQTLCNLNLPPCFLNLDLIMVRELCAFLRKATPSSAAEPEVAFLVHDLNKTMMKLAIFIHFPVVRRQISLLRPQFGFRIDQLFMVLCLRVCAFCDRRKLRLLLRRLKRVNSENMLLRYRIMPFLTVFVSVFLYVGLFKKDSGRGQKLIDKET